MSASSSDDPPDDCEKGKWTDADDVRGDPKEQRDDYEAEIEGDIMEALQQPEYNHKTESLIVPEKKSKSEMEI